MALCGWLVPRVQMLCARGLVSVAKQGAKLGGLEVRFAVVVRTYAVVVRTYVVVVRTLCRRSVLYCAVTL